MSEKNHKNSTGKLMFSLLPIEPLREIMRVRAFGDRKYKPDNWKDIPNARQEFCDAMARHLMQYIEGEKRDEESSFYHMAHIASNALFVMWYDFNEKQNK